jgi:general stress protein YciG
MGIFRNTGDKENQKRRDQQESSRTSQHKNEGNQKKGFASMPHEKVEEIAHKGGRARAEQAGHEGMSEMGKKGGSASHKNRGR